jgi:hypothetical protein
MPTALQNIFYNNTTVKTDAGCTIEYNMNSMIDGITVVSASADTSYTAGITNWPSTKANPFKKLFPVDAIVKSFRPTYPGSKYYINSSSDIENGDYLPFRTVSYTGEGKNIDASGAKPRIYYPGITTSYKYWITPLNGNVDLTVQYLQTSETWAAAGKTGSIPTGNKVALANKIVLKFEKYHTLPSNYTITITKSDASTVVVGPVSVNSTDNGSVVCYLSGGTWSHGNGITGIPDSVTLDQPILIKSIRVTATNPGGYVGVIEISARWVKDISSDMVDFDLNKESSSSSNDILPVGTVTANMFNLNLAKYDSTKSPIIEYNRESAWTTSPSTANAIYMVKNAELRPYLRVFDSGGDLGTSPNQYYKSPQGIYFIDTFDISEFGDASLSAMDGAKYLMDTFCPDLLCDNFPVTAILRNLLDAIGFTSYNFNLATTETSVPQIKYWWTMDSNTVWQAIQELCRDIQMNAVFDNNGILQFYSRDYIYSTTRSATHNFYYSAEGSVLPNIVELTQKEVASANMVKVLWQSPVVSNYTGSSNFLWESPTSYLSAGALKNPASRPNGPAINGTDEFFVIDIPSIDPYATQKSFYNFAGFILIDSEAIEFDAMGYDFTPLGITTSQEIWIESATDVWKYRSLANSGSQYFQPNGKYRIKKENGVITGRGALGTTKADHLSSSSKLTGWTGVLANATSTSPVVYGNDGNISELDNDYEDLTFSSQIFVLDEPSTTSVRVEVPSRGQTYNISVQKIVDGASYGSAITSTTTTVPIVISNLQAGGTYNIKVYASSGSRRGDSQTIKNYTLSSNSFSGAVVSNTVNPKVDIKSANSYLEITNRSTDKKRFSLAYKSFDGIVLPTKSNPAYSYLPVSWEYLGSSYTDAYYAFGTNIFMNSNIDEPNQSGSLAFFVDSSGKYGYHIIVESTYAAASSDRKSIRIVKVTPQGTTVLSDSQVTTQSTFDGLYGGKAYAIDAKVKVSNDTVLIKAYINGFKITASDTNKAVSSTLYNWILGPQKNVGVATFKGKCSFDYVYAVTIDEAKFKSADNDTNLYIGQFANDTLDTAYGNLFYNANNAEDDTNKLKNSIEEFGSVVREILHVKTKFNSRPALPIKWSTGVNQYARIIGQNKSSFGGEAYVLNNTSTTIPLSDGATASFYALGNDIGQSGELEYSTEQPSEYNYKEPITFSSTWLQNETDVKKLADWIKERAMNRSKIIEMSVFGNPTLEVGDIITVKYPHQNLAGTEKLIITRVSHTYNQGLDTSVSCRTL